MAVIIMAQGPNRRFPDKHLQTVCGIPILQRTVDLVRSYTDQVTVVGPQTDFFCGLNCTLHTQRNPGNGLLDGLYNVWPFWDSGALILLGDVVYSRQFLHTMLIDKRPLVMYGRNKPNVWTGRQHAERYGLRVSAERVDYLWLQIAGKTWRAAHEGRLFGLWNRIRDKAVWHECYDWTDDVDLPSDLEAIREHCHTIGDF